jgi:hypothetical protein
MDSRVKAGSARAARRRGNAIAIEIALLALIVLAAAVMRAPEARADDVATLIAQLGNSSDKIRLSAVLNLTKLGDPRGIDPLIQTLKNDSDKNVRGTAAKGLGALVTASVKDKQRAAAVQALTAASNDPNAFVAAQASRALAAINAIAPATPPKSGGGGGGGIYVNIGPMSSKTNSPNDAKLRAMMGKIATKTLSKEPSLPTTWSGGGVPTASALAQKNVMGFYIDGTLNQLTVTTSGSTATISCKVNMLLADFPNKSIFGFLNGGAKVQGSSSPKDIELASEDCVSAVVEDLIAKKIVPTIKTKAGITP